MDLNSKDRKIEDIFGNTEYFIDFYQREYKWRREHIETLLDDIFFKFDNSYKSDIDPKEDNINQFDWYYLNTYVINTQGGKEYIVDGQQRLTTLSIILIKLYHLANSNQLNQSKIEILKRKLYTPKDDGYTFFMGTHNRNDAYTDLFENGQKTISNNNDISVINIYNNYEIIAEYLNEKLNDKHKLECFILYFLKRVSLIQISIPTAGDVAMVFEVINARGERLKSYEILKGELLGQINKTELDEYLEIWNSRIKTLQENADNPDKFLDSFFITFFKSRFTKNTTDIKDFDKDYHKAIFSKKWNQRLKLKVRDNSKNVKSFIKNDFSFYSKIFNDIQYEFYEESKFPYLNFNSLNGLNSQLLPILSSIALNNSEKEIANKIQLVSKLYDRHYSLLQLLGSYDSNKFNDSIIALMFEIRDKNSEEIKTVFDKKLLEDINNAKKSSVTDIFHFPFFKNASYGQYKFTRYLFARVDRFLAKEIQEQYVESYKNLVKNSGPTYGYDIEHILPHNEESISYFEKEEDFEIERNKLGALVLLNNSVNRSSQEETYENKLKTYANNGTLWAKTLTDGFYHKTNIHFRRFYENYSLDFKPVKKFDQTAIEYRQKLLFDIIKIIWGDKYLFGNNGQE